MQTGAPYSYTLHCRFINNPLLLMYTSKPILSPYTVCRHQVHHSTVELHNEHIKTVSVTPSQLVPVTPSNTFSQSCHVTTSEQTILLMYDTVHAHVHVLCTHIHVWYTQQKRICCSSNDSVTCNAVCWSQSSGRASVCNVRQPEAREMHMTSIFFASNTPKAEKGSQNSLDF